MGCGPSVPWENEHSLQLQEKGPEYHFGRKDLTRTRTNVTIGCIVPILAHTVSSLLSLLFPTFQLLLNLHLWFNEFAQGGDYE